VPITEEEANVFAAALLMPARLIREHYPQVGNHAEMCRLFGASGAAMGKRLHKRDLTATGLVGRPLRP
jgi:Zn-dependent peptidase ImmA (M78 family)